MTQKDSDSELPQLDLGLSPRRERPIQLAPLEFIARLSSRRESYRKAVDESGMDADEVAGYLGMDPGQFNRVLRGTGKHLDDDKETLFERVCGNAIPTQYGAYQHGFELKPIRTALERENAELRQQLAEQQREIETLLKYGVLGRAKD